MRVASFTAIIAWYAVAFLLGLAPATAEKRVALVIGNSAYKNAPQLPNPKNDAEDIAAALTRTGFETILGLDLDKAGMEDATIRFARSAREADVAIFYYSGHAMQFSGVNYLMPVDAKLADEADLRRMARVDDIVADVQQAKNLRIVVLDSCRDNPLAEELKRSIGRTRAAAVQRGLAKIDSPQGMIISYSTQAGRTADDGRGRNSPYTAAFLRHIETPEEIGTIFRNVSEDVFQTTQRTQLPELSLSIIGKFYLKGQLDITIRPTTPQQPALATDPAERAWNAIRDTTSIAIIEEFIRQHGDSFYASFARARLEELKRSQIVVVAPANAPNTTPVAPARPQPQQTSPTLPPVNSTVLPEIKWRLTSSFPKLIPTSSEQFADRIAELSGGRFEFKHFYAGEVVPGLQALDAVQNGTVELGYTAGYYYFGKDVAFQFLTGVPFGFEARQHLAWRQRPDVKAIFERFLSKYNVVALPCGSFGQVEDFWSRRPINSVSDLNAIKLRVGGWQGRIYSKYGAILQAVAGGDIYSSLEKGTLDAAQWITPSNSERLGFNKVAKYYYYPSVALPSVAIDLFVNKSSWDQLPPGGRQIIERACVEATNAMLADYEREDGAAITRLKNAGAIIAPLPFAVQKRLYDANRELTQELSASNADLKALMAIVDTMAKETMSAKYR